MQIKRHTTLQVTIDQAWEVLGHQFTAIHRWSSAVHHAEGHGTTTTAAPCDERSCSTTLGDLREKLLTFDPKQYRLSYEVLSGLPPLFRSGTNQWSLTPTADGQVQVQSHVTFVWKSPLFRLAQPIIQWQMRRFVDVLLEDFKHYVEKGVPHPRKLRLQQA